MALAPAGVIAPDQTSTFVPRDPMARGRNKAPKAAKAPKAEKAPKAPKAPKTAGASAGEGPGRSKRKTLKTVAAVAGAAIVLGVANFAVPHLAGNTATATKQDGLDVIGAEPIPKEQAFTEAQAATMAGLVQDEDRRLINVKTLTTMARSDNTAYRQPFRVAGAKGYTLVLTNRSTPYTLTDLLKLAPQTFNLMSDGSYLLSENIAVLSRAELKLAAPGGMVLRLASQATGFVAITTFGGKLTFSGSSAAPMTITSWDQSKSIPDIDMTDGRAYLRAIGGQVSMSYVKATHLGFWSGRTGGVSLNGTTRPATGDITSIDDVQDLTGSLDSLAEEVGPDPISPAGELPAGTTNPVLGTTVPSLSYVSSDISNSSFDGNAFGLFVTGASGVQIKDTSVIHSLINGVLVHRYVSGSSLERVNSAYNVGDGFNLDRATTGITISNSLARGNSKNGIVISGRPLAEGTNATGSSISPFGNNSVSNSSSIGNGHYGIVVNGGLNIGVTGNKVSKNDMGIVVSDAASKVTIVGNTVTSSKRHGIALTEGAKDITVTGNIIDHAGTGIYLRDASGLVETNTVKAARTHGVSVVGAAEGTEVNLNTLSGHGISALDKARSDGKVTIGQNVLAAWHDTSPWYTHFSKLLQPISLVWVIVLSLIGMTAIQGRRRMKRQGSGRPHPYEHQRQRWSEQSHTFGGTGGASPTSYGS